MCLELIYHFFRVETNLSAPLKVLERVPTNCDIKATFHPEFANVDEFVEKSKLYKKYKCK